MLQPLYSAITLIYAIDLKVMAFLFDTSCHIRRKNHLFRTLYDHLPEDELPIVGVKVISQAVQGIGTFINLRPAALINTAVR